MEAVRPSVKNWSVMEGVVSFLLTIMMLILGRRWGVAETVAFGTVLDSWKERESHPSLWIERLYILI
jgi:hypothetical protein